MGTEDDLQKFVTAQEHSYNSALQEMKSGRKRGHWIWYVFPQIAGLGVSSTSAFYGIEDLDQATRYLRHPVLGRRLLQVSEAVLAVEGKSANQIMGSPDDLKLRSSMTLFSLVENAEPAFQAVLDKYFNGKPDQKTLDIVDRGR